MNYLSLTALIASIAITLPGCWESRNCSTCVESQECATCPSEFPPATGPSYDAEMAQAETLRMPDGTILQEVDEEDFK